MVKLFAILTASAAVAGGATFAVFHHIDPNHCPLSGCEVTKPACCALPPGETASADPAACTESPVSAEASCCATAAKPAARASCCASAAACCSPVSACCPVLTAAIGPAAAVR